MKVQHHPPPQCGRAPDRVPVEQLRDREVQGPGVVLVGLRRLVPVVIAGVGVLVTLDLEDVGEPVHGGHQPGDVTRGRLGHEGLEPVLAGVGPHTARLAGLLGPLGGQRGVGLDDRGLQHAAEPAPRD